jgi:hypothetical protein
MSFGQILDERSDTKNKHKDDQEPYETHATHHPSHHVVHHDTTFGSGLGRLQCWYDAAHSVDFKLMLIQSLIAYVIGHFLAPSFSEACDGDCCGGQDLPKNLFMHRPKPHITAQGNMASRMGAMPAATSEFQLSATPMTTARVPSASSARQVPR